MSVALIVIVVLFIAGIIFVTSRTPIKQSREQFLKELSDYVEGDLSKIKEFDDSYRVTFEYQGIEFLFEDIDDIGFKGRVSRYFLKTRLDDIFNLSFYEKSTKSTFRSEVFHQSGWDKMQECVLTALDIPKGFYDMDISSNNYNKAKNFFLDEKARHLLISFKNYDARKHPFLSIRFVAGVLILEFHPVLTYTPNILALNGNVPAIDEFLDKLIIFVKAFNKDYS